jgi:hypothetical protein
MSGNSPCLAVSLSAEERPAIKSSQHRHCRGMGAEHEVAAYSRRQYADEDSRGADNDKGEDNVGAVELQSLHKIVEARLNADTSGKASG